MQIEKIKALLDACYQAKRIRDMLPPLPEGVAPSYIQYLDTIQKLQKQGRAVRVSDVSGALKLPRPGVTRVVKEMEAAGYLQKSASEEDGRVTYLSMTEAGRALLEEYDGRFFGRLAPALSEISDEEAETAIRVIGAFYQVMCERVERHDDAAK